MLKPLYDIPQGAIAHRQSYCRNKTRAICFPPAPFAFVVAHMRARRSDSGVLWAPHVAIRVCLQSSLDQHSYSIGRWISLLKSAIFTLQCCLVTFIRSHIFNPVFMLFVTEFVFSSSLVDSIEKPACSAQCPESGHVDC